MTSRLTTTHKLTDLTSDVGRHRYHFSPFGNPPSKSVRWRLACARGHCTRLYFVQQINSITIAPRPEHDLPETQANIQEN